MKTLQDGGLPFQFSREYEQQFEGLNLSMFQQNSSTSNMSYTESLSEQNSPVSYEEGESSSAMDLSANDASMGAHEEVTISWNNEDFWKKYCLFFDAQENCSDKCEHNYSDHYHCMIEHCDIVFK